MMAKTQKDFIHYTIYHVGPWNINGIVLNSLKQIIFWIYYLEMLFFWTCADTFLNFLFNYGFQFKQLYSCDKLFVINEPWLQFIVTYLIGTLLVFISDIWNLYIYYVNLFISERTNKNNWTVDLNFTDLDAMIVLCCQCLWLYSTLFFCAVTPSNLQNIGVLWGLD